jgi:tetratricopeptide (TPR) repeat protein
MAADLARFVRSLDSGAAPRAAFGEAFGEDVAGLDTQVTRYLKSGVTYFRGRLVETYPATQMVVRRIGPADIAERIGHLCLIKRNYKDAEKYFSAALAADPDHAAAMVGLADLHKFADRFAEAEPLYARAIELEPDVATHELDFGEYFMDRARNADSEEEARRWIGEARRHLDRSLVLDPRNPETLAVYGQSYLMLPGEAVGKGLDKLILAHSHLPSNPVLKLMLAGAYLSAGMKDQARNLANQVLAWSHEEAAGTATELLARIDATEGRPAN